MEVHFANSLRAGKITEKNVAWLKKNGFVK